MGSGEKPDRKPAARRRRVGKLESPEAKPGIQRNQTEQLLKDLFINSPIGLYIVQDGCFRLVSPAFQRTLGYSEDELIGAPSLQFVFPDDRDVVRENAVKMLRGQRFSPYEFRFVTKGGEVRWVTEAVISVHYLGKRAALGSFVDITERKQAEEMVRRAAEEWNATFSAITELVSVQDRNFRILKVNKAYTDFFRVKPEEIIGKTCYQVVHGTDEPPPHCPFKHMLATGKPTMAEFFEPRLGIYVQVSTSPMLEERGEIIGCVHHIKDITERKQAENELRRSEANLAEAQRIAHLGSWELDVRTRKLRWSDEMYRIYGIDRQNFAATLNSALTCIHPHDREAVRIAIEEAIRNKQTYEHEHCLLQTDGSERFVHSLGEIICDESGEPIKITGTCHDITERKKMEGQLIIQDRLASIGQLASGIAHELNNPLTSVIGFSDMLLKRDLPDDVKEDLKIVNSEALRTARTVKGLLTFARKQTVEKEPVDINNIIGGVLQLRDYEHKVSNVEVHARFAPDLPQVTGNGAQLQQVFMNIIVNAEQAMLEAHGRGTLIITTQPVGDMLRATFADDGPGISHEHMRQLFTPFFTTKEAGKGTGLGLSICHGIVTAHGGKIYAESELGEGATFIVELPIASPEEGQTNEKF